MIINRIRLSVVLVPIFLLPWLPALAPEGWFFPYISAKGFAFRILVEVAFVFWVLLATLDKNYRPRFSWLLPPLATLAIIMFVANLLGEHPPKSFWSLFERMDGYVTLIHWVLLVLIMGSVMKDRPLSFFGFKITLWQAFFCVTAIATLPVIFVAIKQLTGLEVITQGGDRITGTLGNASFLAVYLLFVFFTSLFVVWKSRWLWLRLIGGAWVLVLAGFLIWTSTRGTILGLVAGLGLTALIIVFFDRRAKKLRHPAIGIVIAVCLLFGGLWLTATPVDELDPTAAGNAKVIERLTHGFTLSALETRFTIWGIAWEGVKERPLLGWGQGNFDYVFNKHYNPALYDLEPWYNYPHNIALNWLVFGGSLGALAYFSIWLAVFYYLFYRALIKKDTSFTVPETAILSGLLFGYLTHNLVVFDYTISYMFFAITLAYIHAKVATPIKAISKIKTISSANRQCLAFSVALFGLGTIIYFVNLPGMTVVTNMLDLTTAKTPTEMTNLADHLLGEDTLGDREVRSLLADQATTLPNTCLLYTSPSPRDRTRSRMPSSA